MKSKKNSRRSPKQERSKETVDAILEATAQILKRAQTGDFSTNQIAERAGISIGGLYQYFTNKEAILAALCIREREKDMAAMAECLVEIADSPLETQIRRLLETSLSRIADQPRLRLVLEREALTTRSKEALRSIRVHLAELLNERAQQMLGRRLPEDSELRFFVLVSGIEASFHAAIAEYGAKLDRPLLIGETAELVGRFLTRLCLSTR